MKKLLKLFLFLLMFYLLIQIGIQIFSSGYTINYEVDGFNIKEVRTKRTKNEIDNYYLEITKDNLNFNIQTYKNYNKSKIIKKIKYFEDENYKCILPLTSKSEFINLVCEKDNIFYSYMTIKGADSKLDTFAMKYIKSSDKENKITKDNITLYNNLDENTYIGLENYKGLYLINNKNIIDLKLFKNDTYEKNISGFFSKYYITADYNNDYEFHEFYIVDYKNNKKKKIISNKAISMYSYVQGVINNKIYIFDPVNKRQYEINNKIIKEIGNEKIGIKKYKNKTFETANIYDAINDKMYFNPYSTNNKNYEKVDLVGNVLSGYYYMYEKTNSGYKVYRSNVQNILNITYLFETTNIDNVVYINDEVYFKDDNYIKYYSDLNGVKRLIKYDELKFNSSLKFSVYKR